MEKAWYIAVDGTPVGPHSRESLEHLRAAGKIAADAMVWREGMSGWTPYAESGLSSPSPPPIPPPIPVRATSEAASDHILPVNPPVELSHNVYGFADAGRQSQHESEQPPAQAVDDDGWQSTKPAPWRRYFARMFDAVILGALIWMVLGLAFAALSTQMYQTFFGTGGLADNPLLSTMMTFALMMPVEALMLGLSGTTAGKWVFGMRVTDSRGCAIGFSDALRREGAVFLRGLGLGIPIVSLFTLVSGYNALTKSGFTTWDRGEPWIVTYRRSGAVQISLSIVGVVVLVASLVIIRAITDAKI